MDNPLRTVLASLAVYRLAQFVAVDDGPFSIFKRLRAFFGVRAAREDSKGIWHELAELLSCPFCVGVWFALGVTAILGPVGFVDFLLLWLGIAGAQAVLEGRHWE